MIDHLRSVVRVEVPPSLKGILTPGSGRGRSIDTPRGESTVRDPTRSSQERVLALLDANGGRMWQQSIVSETGYSEAHVSRLLGEMEDGGVVERHWSGGEKVVVLDREPAEAIRSERPS